MQAFSARGAYIWVEDRLCLFEGISREHYTAKMPALFWQKDEISGNNSGADKTCNLRHLPLI